jgi:hypothetical protein
VYDGNMPLVYHQEDGSTDSGWYFTWARPKNIPTSDTVTYSWTLTPPTGSGGTEIQKTDQNEPEAYLPVSDFGDGEPYDGTWKIVVTAASNGNKSAPATGTGVVSVDPVLDATSIKLNSTSPIQPDQWTKMSDTEIWGTALTCDPSSFSSSTVCGLSSIGSNLESAQQACIANPLCVAVQNLDGSTWDGVQAGTTIGLVGQEKAKDGSTLYIYEPRKGGVDPA